jgi:glycerol-3-phosphate dehydrogenase
MIPKTTDGRVFFVIPWHGATIVGTTDEPVDDVSTEPRALSSGKKFLLDHVARYFGRRPRAEKILSVWSGLRSLVKKNGVKRSQLSRDHTVLVSPAGLVTVTGGKWTTYRRMGYDTINRAADVASLPKIGVANIGVEDSRLDRGFTRSNIRLGACLWIRFAVASRALRRGQWPRRPSSSAPSLSCTRSPLVSAL